MLDWLAFRLCDVAALVSYPVWMRQRIDVLAVGFMAGEVAELPLWADARRIQFADWQGVKQRLICCDGWRPGRYV